MQKKRRLTATFCEIPQEKDTLRRSWRLGEHSDWAVALGPHTYNIHKVIVATGERASAFLAASFRKHCGQSERTDLTDLLPKSCWAHFEALLDYIYSGEVSVVVENWGAMVKMADLLQIGSLFSKCVEVGSDLITTETAAKIASDAVELQLGGDLQAEVVQIAVEMIAPHFSSYDPKDLIMLPMQVFELLLRRDDLEVLKEDQVFEFLLQISSELGSTEMKQLWKCCRLNLLSPERVLDVASINEIPKEAVVLAFAQRSASPRTLTPPAWTHGWGEACSPRGREITFLVANPSAYSNKRHLRSVAHRLCDRFWWRLLIFPLGTDSTGNPRQVAAFVELVPDPGLETETWSYKRVKYSITLVNWACERRSITKEHTFDFSAAELDNGWHRGWVTPDCMTSAAGWLNEAGEMCFRARCCIKNAVFAKVDQS